jgi:DNA-binding IscR family transcriptional regulator
MTEQVKKEYRKVKAIVKDTVDGNDGLTLEEVVEKSGVSKWYCKQKLDKLVEKGLVVLTEGKYSKVTV